VKRFRTLTAAVLPILATLLMTGQAGAETYPSRGIRLVVPISAGSVTDVAARLTAQELSDRLGVNVVVENRPGTNMVVGAVECAKSDPDGYRRTDLLGRGRPTRNPRSDRRASE
jgi:tripartite-type tricarboxylate transporter receptor subunit TctC